MNKLFFQLYNTGLINQLMSFELAAGLSHELNVPVVIHYGRYPVDPNLYVTKSIPIFSSTNKQREGFTNNKQFPHLLDLIDFNQNIIVIHQKIESFDQEELVIDDILNNFYYSNQQEISEDEKYFAEGRKRLPLDKTLHLKELTLGCYSRFFYKRNNSLNKAISSVQFKKEYVNLANKISNSLGNFQGMHLRLSDHVNMFNTTQEMFEEWLDKFGENNLPIVVSTCEPGHKMVQDNKDKFILLDEYIVNNFADDFKALPFQDEAVFGLICNLVMHEADIFVGTSGSTYTAYIHRNRHQKGIETWNYFDNPPRAEGKPYSWNEYPLNNGIKMWWREWPESKC
jgi:hypothetical protein